MTCLVRKRLRSLGVDDEELVVSFFFLCAHAFFHRSHLSNIFYSKTNQFVPIRNLFPLPLFISSSLLSPFRVTRDDFNQMCSTDMSIQFSQL